MDIAGVILHVIFKIPPDILGSVIVVKKENFWDFWAKFGSPYSWSLNSELSAFFSQSSAFRMCWKYWEPQTHNFR